MPIYYFDLQDGSGVHRDDVGVDLPDTQAAIAEARRALAEMSKDGSPPDGATQDLSILIRDHDEPVRVVMTVRTERVSGRD